MSLPLGTRLGPFEILTPLMPEQHAQRKISDHIASDQLVLFQGYNRAADVPSFRYKTWSVRNSHSAGRWRHGRGVPRVGHAPRTHRGHQSVARALIAKTGTAPAPGK